MDLAFPQRKHPVHMSPVERHNEPTILFVTLAIQPRAPFLANAWVHDAFVGACGDADAWDVGFYLIMPDHVHFFCRPARVPAVGLRRWTAYLKERTTKRLRQSGTQHGSAQPRPPNVVSTGWAGSAQPRCPGVRSVEGEAAPSRLPWRWQSDCWDTQLRGAAHYHERWEYVRQNPVRKALVQAPDQWPWQGTLAVLDW